MNVPAPRGRRRCSREHPAVARRRRASACPTTSGASGWWRSWSGARPRLDDAAGLGGVSHPREWAPRQRGRRSTSCPLLANGKLDRLAAQARLSPTPDEVFSIPMTHPLPRHHRPRGRAAARRRRVGRVQPVPGVRRRDRRALAARRAGGRRRRLARAGARPRPGQRARSRRSVRSRRARSCATRSGCRTAKVKVAEPGQTLAEDVARLEAVRDALGPDGRIRIDANGGWSVDEAVARDPGARPAAGGLEYVEQPCATVEELAAVRRRVDVPDRGRRVDPPGRGPLPGARPRGRRHRRAQGAAARRRACLPADRRGHRAAGRGVERARDERRDRRRRRAGRGAAGAAATPAASPPCSCSPTTSWPSRCCRSTARCPCGGRSVDPSRCAAPPPTPDRAAHWRRAAGRGAAFCGRTSPGERLDRAGPLAASTSWSRAACTDVVLSPGLAQRAAGLRAAPADAADAPAAHPHRRAHGGFLALGLASAATARSRSSPPPAPRVANLHPAVLEAAHAGVPLRAVTADRPARLRGTDANQTTDQVGSSAPPSASSTSAAPSPRRSARRRLAPPARPAPCTSTCSSTSRWCRTRCRTLVRTATTGRARGSDGVATRRSRTNRSAPRWASGRWWWPATTPARRRGCWPSGAGWPLLAEPTSGSRTGAHVIRTYRLLLGDRARRADRAGGGLRSPDAVAAGDAAARPRRRRGRRGPRPGRSLGPTAARSASTLPRRCRTAEAGRPRLAARSGGRADRELGRRLDELLADEPGRSRRTTSPAP